MSYVQVPADALLGALAGAGFAPDPTARGWEKVYARAHDKDPALRVKVYTSIPANADVARGCGKDAIRVVAVAGDRGVFKAKRVYRTGTVDAVVARMMDRAREAYARLNDLRRSRAGHTSVSNRS